MAQFTGGACIMHDKPFVCVGVAPSGTDEKCVEMSLLLHHAICGLFQ